MAKLDNASFMVCCANGSGSSLMMKMTLEKVLKKLNIKPGKIHHCALSEGKSSASQFNVVFCARNFKDMFADAEKKGHSNGMLLSYISAVRFSSMSCWRSRILRM